MGVSFFRELQSRMSGGQSGDLGQMPDHACFRCQIPMTYHGPHSLRTGGMNRGWGVAADVLLGARDEAGINQMMEKNVLTHVFVCGQCGTIEFVNDPQRGF